MALLTERLMVQALADRLVGLPTMATARNLTEPWHWLWTALDMLEKSSPNAMVQEKVATLQKALEAHPERKEILDRLLSMRPGGDDFPSLLEMAKDLRPIQWLWDQWLPFGLFSILASAPKVGKSFLALDLCYRVITGEALPDGQRPARVGPVLYVDGESIPQVSNERAISYGLPREHFYLMLPDEGDLLLLDSEKYQERLIRMIWKIKPALVVIDSLSMINSRGQNNVEDVRGLFNFITQVTREYDLAMLLIHHLRKPGNGQQMQIFEPEMADLSGSGHIVAMARMLWGLNVVRTGAKFDPNGPRQLKMLGTTLTGSQESLGYELVNGVGGGKIIRWLNQAPKQYEEPTEREGCKEWLLEVLADGPVKPSDVVEMGEEAGFTRSLIYLARKTLEGEIENTAGKSSPKNEWQLAGWVPLAEDEAD